MARPKKEADARKSKRITIRLTETEYEVYKEFARRGGFTLSELIRLMMVNGKVSYRMPIVADMPQLKEITAQLAGIGNNLNQIARALNSGFPDQSIESEIRRALGDLAEWKYEILQEVGSAIGNDQTFELEKLGPRGRRALLDLSARREQQQTGS